MQLKVYAVNFHLLVQLPLRTLKRVLLGCMRLQHDETRSHDSSSGSESPFPILTVTAPKGFNAFSIHISSTSRNAENNTQRVKLLVQFVEDETTKYSSAMLKDEANRDARLYTIQLHFCSKCGLPSGGCACCGWRKLHELSAAEEDQSLLEAIDAKLPSIAAAHAMTMARSLYIRLASRPAPSVFEATIFKKKLVHPMIERSYVIYTIEVRHGQLKWLVTRRYQEFARLHLRMAALVSESVLLPELPPKKWLGALDEDFLLERVLLLHDYLKSLLMIDAIHTSVPLLSFLGALSTTSVDHEARTFLRRDVMHLRVLNYYVAPGDLVLFRCCGPMTGSEWDHVGIVVPGANPTSFHLLEATGEGVSAFPLTPRLMAYSAFHIKYVALRKLRTPLLTATARWELLHRFATEVEGKPYGLTVSKLLRAAGTHAPSTTDFFCSELVAEAYKSLGLIDPRILSSNFWPGSFASGGFVDTELGRHGAALDPEVVIDCQLLERMLTSLRLSRQVYLCGSCGAASDVTLRGYILFAQSDTFGHLVFITSNEAAANITRMKKLFKLASKCHGQGAVVFQWQSHGHFLATAGKNGLVHIFNHQGEEYDEIGLDMTAPVLALEWDPEGSTLAILQQGSSIVTLWDLATRATHNLDANLNNSTFIKWSATGEQPAIGTQKGNLVLYSKATRKLVSVLGKHSKRILYGAWNQDGKLVLGSEDRMVTVSTSKGDTIEQRELSLTVTILHKACKHPVDTKFGRKRSTRSQNSEQLIAISIVRSIILLDLDDPANPIELTFQTHYGTIVFLEWHSEGMAMIAFSEGYFIGISTEINEVGEEVFPSRFFAERIYSAAYSPALNRAALSGDSWIKIVSMSKDDEHKEVVGDAIKLTDAEENEASLMSFTADGQILTVATQGGTIQNFLARMPMIYDHYNNYVAYLSSLQELSVVDVLGRDPPIHIAVSIEPLFVTIGPRHVAVGMNNRVWYYRCDGTANDSLVNEQQYLGRVTAVKLNGDYAGVLCDGKASLHLIEPGASTNVDLQEEQGKIFSSSSGGRDERTNEISSIAITKDFFIYGTSNGTGAIHFFYLAEWKFLEGCSYRHDDGVGILQVVPNRDGTRVLFMDSHHRGYLLIAPTREAIFVPSIPSTATRMLWDTTDPIVFIVLQDGEFSLFQYTDITVNGPEVAQLGFIEIHSDGSFITSPQNTRVPPDLVPILICDGIVTCHHVSGKLTSLTSSTHDQLQKASARATVTSAETEKSIFRQNLSLLRMEAAWKLALSIDSRDYWLALACRAMQILDVAMAKRAYRQIGDSGMVLGLNHIESIEEKNLLAGHVLLLFGEYSEARRLFLSSSDPMAALQMQRNLLQWDQALKLADSLAIELVPELSVSYATQLEFREEFEGALKMYEHATNVTDELGKPVPCSEKLRKQSVVGIARCTFRLSDLRRGMKLVSEVGDVALCRECAIILEAMKQSGDTAVLCEKAGLYEKAAQIYIQMKNLAKAAPLMPKVKTPKIHAQFGRAKEAAGEFSAAWDAYEATWDMDNVVRIQLENLHNPEKAFSIVRDTKSSEGALAVAKYCTESGNYKCAIEFLLMANKEEDAFQLALAHNEVDSFTHLLGGTISIERAAKICGNYNKALQLFLQCGDSELSKAIDVVGKARNDMLTHTMIDYLMGESDGIPKDPNFVFRLYMALGNYAQATKTAVIISRQEQELGNYKMAHKIHVSQDLRNALMLLHSYILVKKLVKREDHTAAARMLVRVAKHISKFPTHVSNILISAVIECQRAGLRAYSYDYATTLMKPEHRNTIDKEIKRKIEAIVRRPNKEQAPDPTTPCPCCANELAEADLDCPHCKNWIPYCIVTGHHMVKDDWTQCPKCALPALFSHLTAHLATDSTCPMCEQPLAAQDVTRTPESDVKLSEQVAAGAGTPEP
ncbi:Wd repeat-containing protein 19, partial [Globisporangium splendens]